MKKVYFASIDDSLLVLLWKYGTFIVLVGEIGHLNIINVVLYCSSSEVQPKKIIVLFY